MSLTVELVYDKDCPNVAEARHNLRRAFAAVGVPARWTERETSSPETPAHLRGFGSPTMLVNGRDVAGVEPGDASSCRVYEVGSGRRGGVPPADMIAHALLAAREPQPPGRWRRVLLVLPAIGAALVPGLACPACWPGYAALLSALGLGFIPTAPYLLPLTASFLVIALAALAFRAETRTPLVVGVAASVIVLVGKFVFESSPVTYTGAGLLVAASLSITRARRAAPCSACAPEKSNKRKEVRQ